ncbi:hypothetical protein CRG98_027827 [Punica granatum]|uniref:Uncharacterized protein n=1 Tax=Punica granatum TaxID=22663 RepID=A0A2I0J6B1_PUNGR|nr:hypothetical protein CRG98_027827 [Punica granatum]
MVGGDSFSSMFVTHPWEGGHTQAVRIGARMMGPTISDLGLHSVGDPLRLVRAKEEQPLGDRRVRVDEPEAKHLGGFKRLFEKAITWCSSEVFGPIVTKPVTPVAVGGTRELREAFSACNCEVVWGSFRPMTACWCSEVLVVLCGDKYRLTRGCEKLLATMFGPSWLHVVAAIGHGDVEETVAKDLVPPGCLMVAVVTDGLFSIFSENSFLE